MLCLQFTLSRNLFPLQVLVALNKRKDLSGDFCEPVWELWGDISKEDYTSRIPEPMDLKTMGFMVKYGEWCFGWMDAVSLLCLNLRTQFPLSQ